MWRYWTLLTDIPASEIETMKQQVAAGSVHPMDVKKAMARTITAGFSSAEQALRAEENWSTQFQKGGTSEDTERVALAKADIAFEEATNTIGTDKLMVAAGFCASMGEARRKRTEKAVKIDNATVEDARLPIAAGSVELLVKLGKKTKIVTIS